MAECLPSLTKKQRIIGFMSSLVLGAICFGLAISSGKPFYHVKFLLFVGPIQPHGPFVQQRKAAFYIGLLYHLDRYSVFCNGAPKCNSNSNSCHHASDCLGLVCGQLHPRRTDRTEVFHEAMLWLLQKFSQ